MDLFDYMRKNTMEKNPLLLPGFAHPPWKKWLVSSILLEKISFFTGPLKRIRLDQ